MGSEKILGIDLGTTNSSAAIVEGGKPIIIPSAEGPTLSGKMFPSVVAFTKDGDILVGEPARRQASTNPESTIQHIKRKMGTDYKVKIKGKEYTPQQISAFILQKIKRDAEHFLGEKVEKAVITVPAYFDDNQRTATKDAGKIAGLEVERIINEPTAAALAYGLDKEDKELKIAVLDVGGGTFDVTIMQMGQGVFQVKSTSGDTALGGKDMDDAIIKWMVKKFKDEKGIDLSKDKTAMQRIREGAEKAKIELSNVTTTTINLPFITAKGTEPVHLEMELTRSKLEELIDSVLEKLGKPIIKALEDASLKPGEVDKVILVGGPTRMPIVRKKFKDVLGREAEGGVDPMECVSIGAAIQGAIISGEVKDVLLLDVTPLSLGIETEGGVFTRIIERNTTIPTKKSQIFSTAADDQTMVEIHVLQGERPMAKDNISLGKFQLHDIPPAPRGIPQIEVTFDIDANGIMHVSAKDMATGNENKVTITSTTKMKDEDIERAIKEAEKHADEDKKKEEEIKTINECESAAYTARKTIKTLGDKLSEDKKKKIEDAVEALEKAIEKKDMGDMKSKKDSLMDILGEISTEIYQQAAQKAGPDMSGHASPQNDDKSAEGKKGEKYENVQDAKYKVVDED